MHQQISPWSIYEKGFKIKSLKPSRKQITAQNIPKERLQQLTKIQKRQSFLNEQKQQVITVETKLPQPKLQPTYVQSTKEAEVQQNLAQKELDSQGIAVNTLLEELYLLKLIRHQFIRTNQVLALPQIKKKSVASTKAIPLRHDLYQKRGKSQQLKGEEAHEGQIVQKLSLINYNPFDDSNIIKRGIQLQMKKRLVNKRLERKLISKLLYY